MERVNVSDSQFEPKDDAVVEPKLPDSPEVIQIKEDLGDYKALSSLADSEGGRLLLTNLRKDIASDVESIMGLFRGADLDLRCAVAKLVADFNMYRVLRNADENVKLADEALAELLKSEKN